MGERVIEPEWITEEIRLGIAERKRLKRIERNCIEEEKEKCNKDWIDQKMKVQILVRETKRGWEREMANKIRDCRNQGKMLWNLVDKIRGKKTKKREDEFYKEGEKIEIEEGWGSSLKTGF